MPHLDFILLIYMGSHDLLHGFHVYFFWSGGELGSSPQELEFHGPEGPGNSSVNKVVLVIGCTFITVWPVFLLTSWAGSATLEI